MPFDWTAERERQMLLMAIQQANLKPTTHLWSSVATSLGGGLTSSAVSQKYHKLKNESAKLAARSASAPSTPLKPKACINKITKSPAPAHVRKRKRATGLATTEISESKGEQEPNLQPDMKVIATVPFYTIHTEQNKVKQEDTMVKAEGDMDYFL